MLELGIGADIVRGIGWILWGLIFGAIFMALRFGKSWKQRLFYVGLILTVLIGPLLPSAYRNREHQQRYEAAKAVFDERCKTAGEKVYRTVDDVEGVLLLNVRPRKTDSDYSDPNWPGATLPRESSGEDYIKTFLYWEHQQRAPARGYLSNVLKGARDGYTTFPGYSFVDVKESDGIYRYRIKEAGSSDLLKDISPHNPTRYAVSYRNLVDPADRAHWVAGTVVTITDTLNHQVIAEMTWYSFEPGFGSRAGARMPWLFSIQCPSHEGVWEGGQTRMFVDQVLKPKQGKLNVK